MVSVLLQAIKPQKARLERNKARSFLVVTHNAVKNCKAIVIHWEEFKDEHECHGAFHKLGIARAFQRSINN